ncbi:MAG TPA: hypothetical protein VF605_10765 [Allosphingosinicella sp.]|jgi:hypothetical protein
MQPVGATLQNFFAKQRMVRGVHDIIVQFEWPNNLVQAVYRCNDDATRVSQTTETAERGQREAVADDGATAPSFPMRSRGSPPCRRAQEEAILASHGERSAMAESVCGIVSHSKRPSRRPGTLQQHRNGGRNNPRNFADFAPVSRAIKRRKRLFFKGLLTLIDDSHLYLSPGRS